MITEILSEMIEFLTGFSFGTLINVASIKFYEAWDPTRADTFKLVTVALIQLFVAFIVVRYFEGLGYVKFGIQASSPFLLSYAVIRIHSLYQPSKSTIGTSHVTLGDPKKDLIGTQYF
jgi:hypothetical protein